MADFKVELDNEGRIYAIPNDLRESLKRYTEQRIQTGGFLRAILENDLFETMGRADFINRRIVFDICEYIHNELPSNCWGTKETVATWLGEN